MINRCKSVAIVDCCAIVVDWFLWVSRSWLLRLGRRSWLLWVNCYGLVAHAVIALLVSRSLWVNCCGSIAVSWSLWVCRCIGGSVAVDRSL